MRIIYDPTVDALTIRFVEERVECEVIRLNDQVAVDIGPGERIVAIEVLDASELIPGLKGEGQSYHIGRARPRHPARRPGGNTATNFTNYTKGTFR